MTPSESFEPSKFNCFKTSSSIYPLLTASRKNEFISEIFGGTPSSIKNISIKFFTKFSSLDPCKNKS